MRKKHTSSPSKTKPRRRISDQFQGGEIVLMMIITFVFLLLSLFTLFYHNKNATNGYKLKTLQEARENILFEIEILDRQIADVSAINTKKDEDESTSFLDFEEKKHKTKIIYLKGRDTKKEDIKTSGEIES